jgi:outer membrane protein OmpA-like peptidoglycan-associated protein
MVFPTGTRRQFVGAGSFGVGADLAVGRRWERVRFSTHLGYQFQARSSAVSTVYADDEIRFGAAVSVPIKGPWAIDAEVAGATVVSREGRAALGEAWSTAAHTPTELLLAAMYDPVDSPQWVRVGVGPGLTPGFGTPDIRAFVQVGIARKEPFERRVYVYDDTPKPTANDLDGDGVANEHDRCPTAQEDHDGFESGDGCPDPDNDGDGIPDVEDGHRVNGVVVQHKVWEGFGDCMGVAEDDDGFESDDGCPDRDNDDDGILDELDGPRDAYGAVVWAEGKPGFGACFEQPETLNGNEDGDGCPDEGLAVYDRRAQSIQISGRVYFDSGTARIQQDSYEVLDAVALILTSYPNIELVEVQGHTDVRGNAAYNLELSQMRVDEVRSYLMSQGIAGYRLMAVGYGETEPLVEAISEEGHALNRRVEFVVQEVADP